MGFRAGKRATNNFERERAFPGRLTGVPGKRCFVNAVGNVVRAGVPWNGGGNGRWSKNLNQNGRAIFCCSLSSPPDGSLFPTSFLSLSLFYSACLSHFKLQWHTRILDRLPQNFLYEYVICIVRNILKFPLHHNVTRVSLILFNI